MEHLWLGSPLCLLHALGRAGSFFICLVCLHLADFFHHLLQWMLQWLQHLDENVGIVSGDPLLLLRFSPCLVDTFCLVRLVLVGGCWPWLRLRGHGTHVSCRLWSRGHNFRGLLFTCLVFSQLPSGVLNVVGLFCNSRLGCLLPCYGPMILGRSVGTSLTTTHPKPACA